MTGGPVDLPFDPAPGTYWRDKDGDVWTLNPRLPGRLAHVMSLRRTAIDDAPTSAIDYVTHWYGPLLPCTADGVPIHAAPADDDAHANYLAAGTNADDEDRLTEYEDAIRAEREAAAAAAPVPSYIGSALVRGSVIQVRFAQAGPIDEQAVLDIQGRLSSWLPDEATVALLSFQRLDPPDVSR